MTRTLVLFCKAPRPGQAKTRLSPPLSPGAAAALALAFLRDSLLLAETLADHELLLAYTPRGAHREMEALVSARWRLCLQRGADLGERLDHVLQRLLSHPGSRALVIGSDSPHLPPERLAEAVKALDRADLVLGPTDDGGYYLVGLRRWIPGLFEGVRWSSEHALADTLARAAELGLQRELLAPGFDVDDAPGLRRFLGELDRLPEERLPHTRAAVTALRATLGTVTP